MDNAGNLSDLRPLAIPAEPSLWPAGPGAWIIGILLLALFLQVFFHAWRKWRRNAYRRVALKQLDPADSVHTVSVLLKRVALAAWEREHVASLHGQDWVLFLRTTCPSASLDELVSGDTERTASDALLKNARIWILRHSREVFPEARRDA